MQGITSMKSQSGCVFFITAYIIWQYKFAIQRYAIVVDLLAPLIIYLLVKDILSEKLYRRMIIFFIFAFLLITMKPMNWGRTTWEKDFLDVKISYNLDENEKAIVVLLDRPLGFLSPFFPHNWQIIIGKDNETKILRRVIDRFKNNNHINKFYSVFFKNESIYLLI